MAVRRSSEDIIYDMLKCAANGRPTKTDIMYVNNLSYWQSRQYIEFGLRRGIITPAPDDPTGITRFALTNRGREFMAHYESLREILDGTARTQSPLK
ncbi:MAG: hypothetical protein HY365_01025 [Candidatus Aenigmarchaeota archaeon]|nr:hypothetical protein [Candidatus Aenigmarchaeota archaeon]